LNNLLIIVQGALESALLTLLDYLSLHVLLCLIPAFFIAGAMTYFIPKDMVMHYLGKDSDPKIAYPMATAGGFLLAVCSCTVLPLFAGIWKRGAGLGPAITFLFVAPAINILALTYTGTLIGMDIALARGFLAILFAILIGIIMANLFGNETEYISNIQDTNQQISSPPTPGNVQDTPKNEIHYGIETSILLMLFGISSVSLAILDSNIIETIGTLVFSDIPLLSFLFRNPPLLQTVVFLVGLTFLVIATFKIHNDKLLLFLWLFFALMTGTSQIKYFTDKITVNNLILSTDVTNMFVKLILTGIVIIGLITFVIKKFDSEEIEAWLTETWYFVKSIFPLIIIGVTVAGFIKFFIPPDLVALLVGQNTVLANLIGVLFGVFMYFPTLMEVPIAKIFLDLGMARGPLLAYLLADPELSIQSILVTRKFLGEKKNTVYVGLVTVFSVIAGLIFGFFLGQGISLW
jgi:uncharacterized membrane protein YraQ (UPF0718 family)